MLKPSAIRASSKLIASTPGCISFAAGCPAAELMPASELRAIADKILIGQSDLALQYGMTRGNSQLIAETVALLARKSLPCSAEQIQITTGSQQGIYLTGLLCLDAGDYVAVENPTYLGALASYNLCEARYLGIEADDDGMIMEDLEEKLHSNNRVKLIYVIPNFSNPTGKTWSLARRRRVLEIAAKYDLYIVEDDPYGEIRFEGEALPSVKSLDTEGRVIYLGSYSKILCAGLRVGFTVSSPAIAEKFELFKQGVDLQSTEFTQMLVGAYLRQCDLTAQVSSIVSSYGHKRKLMLDIIDAEFPKSVRRTNPQGGMFVWLELPAGADAGRLLEKSVKDAGVGFVPGGPFFVDNGHENTIRLNYSTVSEEQIEEGMRKLAALLRRELAS